MHVSVHHVYMVDRWMDGYQGHCRTETLPRSAAPGTQGKGRGPGHSHTCHVPSCLMPYTLHQFTSAQVQNLPVQCITPGLHCSSLLKRCSPEPPGTPSITCRFFYTGTLVAHHLNMLLTYLALTYLVQHQCQLLIIHPTPNPTLSLHILTLSSRPLVAQFQVELHCMPLGLGMHKHSKQNKPGALAALAIVSGAGKCNTAGDTL